MMPDPQAMVLTNYADGKPRAGVKVGHVVMSLRQADEWALNLLEEIGKAREFDQRTPVAVTCERCRTEWKTPQFGASRCPKCNHNNKVPKGE